MTFRVMILGVICGSVAALCPLAPANAECHFAEHVIFQQGGATVVADMVCTDEAEPEEAGVHGLDPETAATAVCIAESTELFGLSAPWCNLPIQAGEAEQVAGGLVAAALRRLPLPPSELIVQPPNGRTLVNFDTNFYTETQPFDRTIRLFGQRVDLRIWPTSYEWQYGDGAVLVTASAGSPYPDLEITHSYTDKGSVSPAVDTTYSADFRVNGGPWRPVPGTVTVPGSSVSLEVVEATPTLVGYH